MHVQSPPTPPRVHPHLRGTLQSNISINYLVVICIRRCLAKGGVYIAGGVAPKLLARIKLGGFAEAFVNPSGRPRFTEILKGIPLYVISNESVGVLGTVQYAVRILKSN